ncbi:hypothetical protein GCM10011415_25200 [Salipiger pallidus]|uniref:SsuA/THI5-like domain-containing protein n=1 Tax=Salipiger pallidus TaxID=1775170 RepID=A0A8J2ZL13_9RHOB|nr:ABC transporter substrate-binding protein [Salipiger pallidus]GGG75571.1 hypothetical protein GCM10011415_25200 [Salipiger pallidus]
MPYHCRLTIVTLGAIAAAGSALAEPITFAWTPNPQTPQVDVALQNGYFEDAGVELDLVAFRTGREGFEAMLGRQVDVTFMAEFPAAVGALRGQDFAVIGDLARFTGSRIIVSRAAATVEGPQDLQDLRIGTTIGTNVNYFLDGILREAGVEAQVIGAAPTDLVPALARGDVDAIAPFPSFYAAAREAIGDDYAELRAPGYEAHFILAASPEMTTERGVDLDAFMKALARADADVRADPEAAMEAVAQSMQGAVSIDQLGRLWQDLDIGLQLDAGLADLLAAEGDWILEQGVVRGEAKGSDAMLEHFAPEALRRAAPEAVSLP